MHLLDSRPPDPSPRRSDAHVDDGSSLIEIMISIALLGSIVIALATAVQTLLLTSSSTYEAAQLETILINASESVERARPQCEYDEFVQAAAIAEGWPASSMTATVEILVANTGDPTDDWAAQDCSVPVESFDVQRLTIRAQHPTKQLSRTLTVVKSDVSS